VQGYPLVKNIPLDILDYIRYFPANATS